MLLCLFLLGILGLALAAQQVVRRHAAQACAVVWLGPGLADRRLEGALRSLARQRGRYRRIYLWDGAPAPRRQQILKLLSRELGFYLPDRAELARLQSQGDCRLLSLDGAGRLHKYKG